MIETTDEAVTLADHAQASGVREGDGAGVSDEALRRMAEEWVIACASLVDLVRKARAARDRLRDALRSIPEIEMVLTVPSEHWPTAPITTAKDLAQKVLALASGEESREPASAGPAEEPRRLPRERCSRCEPDGDRCFPCA